jgi:8-oxo-dGTP pyrophosphatase MutT (NUDIX family)
MAFLDHIATCNAFDAERYVPLLIAGRRVGRVRRDTARLLVGLPDIFAVGEELVELSERLDTPEARSAALDTAGAWLAERHGYAKARGERYVVAGEWGERPLATVDRGQVSIFGFPAYGIHVNGYVERDDGLHLWIGRRAPDKAVAPGKLDNMVAGGQPAGLTLFENLLKEAAEEADLPPAIAATARPVGAVSYTMEDQWGLKPDLMFCYDLEVPAGFVPRNTDGEITDFQLMPVEEVARLVRDTDQFKFNVNLVIIDFLIRHGIVGPDDEPDYVQLVQGLRR